MLEVLKSGDLTRIIMVIIHTLSSHCDTSGCST